MTAPKIQKLKKCKHGIIKKMCARCNDAEQALGAAAGWVWSTALPTRNGWYWYLSEHPSENLPKCVRIEIHPTLGAQMRDGRMPMRAEAWPGKWCGPIPDPVTPNSVLDVTRADKPL